jgi:hypothetical protein
VTAFCLIKLSGRAVDNQLMDHTPYPNPMRVRRAKAVAKTEYLLDGHGACRMYAFGVSGPDPQRSWLWIAAGVIGVCIALAVVTGPVLLPGLLAIALPRWSVNPPRGVGIEDKGVVVVREHLWNARPASIAALVPRDSLFSVTATTRSHVRVQLGFESIWLRRTEHNILVDAAGAIMPTLID